MRSEKSEFKEKLTSALNQYERGLIGFFSNPSLESKNLYYDLHRILEKSNDAALLETLSMGLKSGVGKTFLQIFKKNDLITSGKNPILKYKINSSAKNAEKRTSSELAKIQLLSAIREYLKEKRFENMSTFVERNIKNIMYSNPQDPLTARHLIRNFLDGAPNSEEKAAQEISDQLAFETLSALRDNSFAKEKGANLRQILIDYGLAEADPAKSKFALTYTFEKNEIQDIDEVRAQEWELVDGDEDRVEAKLDLEAVTTQLKTQKEDEASPKTVTSFTHRDKLQSVLPDIFQRRRASTTSTETKPGEDNSEMTDKEQKPPTPH